MKKKKWLVYCHTNKINGKKYIGITSKKAERRWCNGKGYAIQQVKFNKAIQKYGWDNFTHEILEENIPTLEEANKLEKHYIELYDTYNNGYNSTIGGDGTNGYKHTREYCEQLSKKRKGKNNPMYNKPSVTAKKIVQIDLEGNILKVYNNTYEPANIYKTTPSSICACIHYRKKIVKGYIWLEYLEDEQEMKKKIKERFEQMKLDKIENSKKRSHKIKEMWAEKDFRNKMQKIINSEEHKLKLSEASKKMWSNEEYRKTQSEKHKGNVSKNKKRIAQYDLNGNFIKEYESIQDASIKNNINSKNISSVCKGKRHKAGKYIWKYI